MFKNLDEKNKRMLLLLGGVIVFFILIIFIVGIVGMFRNSSLSYTEIEEKIVSASKEYFSNRNDALPINDGESYEISASTLAETGYMKPLVEYQKDDTIACSGKVTVTKNGDYYSYAPYLNCGDKYTTQYLYEKLIAEVVSKDDGLYKVTEQYENKGKKTAYVYKGDYANNYLKIDESLWRIVKIDSNFNLVITEENFNIEIGYNDAWDNRYNSELNERVGINDYYKSIIRTKIIEYYNTLPEILKEKTVSRNLCVGTRSLNDTNKDGSVECSKILENQYVGLLNTHDYMNASLDVNCKTIKDKACSNYNYLTSYERSFWLLNTNKENIGKGYKYSAGAIIDSKLSSNSRARAVVGITKDSIFVSGNGTYDDPYIVR